jgi:hypothetical protein
MKVVSCTPASIKGPPSSSITARRSRCTPAHPSEQRLNANMRRILVIYSHRAVEMSSMITFSLLVIEHPLNTELQKRFCLVHEIDDRFVLLCVEVLRRCKQFMQIQRMVASWRWRRRRYCDGTIFLCFYKRVTQVLTRRKRRRRRRS